MSSTRASYIQYHKPWTICKFLNDIVYRPLRLFSGHWVLGRVSPSQPQQCPLLALIPLASGPLFLCTFSLRMSRVSSIWVLAQDAWPFCPLLFTWPKVLLVNYPLGCHYPSKNRKNLKSDISVGLHGWLGGLYSYSGVRAWCWSQGAFILRPFNRGRFSNFFHFS